MKILFTYALIIVIIILGFLEWKNQKSEKNKNNALPGHPRRIADMTGKEFENFVASLFIKMGYRVRKTPGSKDYGADLILCRNGLKIAVQTKRWKSKVGVRAVQEIAGAVPFYNADKGIVITNNLITKEAYKLADCLGVELWDGYQLLEFIKCANNRE